MFHSLMFGCAFLVLLNMYGCGCVCVCVFGSLWVLIKRLGLPVLQCNDTFCVLSLSIFSPCSLIVGSAFTSFLLQFLCILV